MVVNGRPKVAIYGRRGPGEDLLPKAVERAGCCAIPCETPELLLEQSVRCAPDVILCRFGALRGVQLGVLRLIRRLVPRTPLLVLSEGTTLEVQRSAQEFRPIFFLLEPWEPSELRELIRSTIAQRTRRERPTSRPEIPS